MNKLNLAVLGLSHGWKFAERLQNCKFANLIAVADLSIGEALHSYGINTANNNILANVKKFKDYKNLLDDIGDDLDGVIAALPNDLHLEVTKEAAKRGISLLLEKPIASNVADAEKIAEIIEKSNINFLVGHIRRFSKKIRKVKEIIAENMLGKFIGANVMWAGKKPYDYFNSWRLDKKVGGPLLINAIHDVDDLRYIIGEIDRVQAYVTNNFRGNEVEDTAVINLGFKNGALATIFLSDTVFSPWFFEGSTEEYNFFYPKIFDCYYFFGKKASVSFPSLKFYFYEKNHGEDWHKPFKCEKLSVGKFDMFEEELKHFCNLINGKEESIVSAREATKTLRVIEAIKQSSDNGKSIYL
jgi:predicted dehydrogenase